MFLILLTLITTAFCYPPPHNYNPPNQLPEIIINRAIPYDYPTPNPPVLFDEPTFQPPSQIPQQDEYLPPTYPIPTEEPPNSYLPPSTVYGVPTLKSLQVLNMSCLDSGSERFFRGSFRSPLKPVTEKGDCVFGSGDIFEINAVGSRMEQCGVNYCSDKFICLQLRIPTVRGLKLPEDTVVNLQCKPQNSVVSQVKQLKVKSSNSVQGRSLQTIASGGAQRNFESQVALYRRPPGSAEYSQLVTPGSSVILGEDLLLRTSVRDGDGWKYSRMGSVVVQNGRMASRDSVTLVNNLGCRASNMRAICPNHPRQVNPLVTTMPMRAFMFQGAQQGDEMILSVKIYACLQPEDCIQSRHCEEKVQGRVRARRETENGTTRAGEIVDWESYLDFKVLLPENNARKMPAAADNETIILYGLFLGGFLLVLVAITCLLVLFKTNKSQ